MTKKLPLQKHLFDIPDEVTFLNHAFFSPQLRAMTEIGLQSVRAKSSPWNYTPQHWFEDGETLRGLIAQVVGVASDDMAIIPSVSYGMAIAAKNITVRSDQNIVVLHEEFPSNYYAWYYKAKDCGAALRVVHRTNKLNWTEAICENIDEKTAVVAVPNCHWTDGARIDLERVSQKARSAKAALVIDASQSLGAFPIPIEKIRPDFLISVGYKWLLGPYSLGYLYVDLKWQEGTPIEYSWLNRFGSENFSRLIEYTDKFRQGARRYDMGEFSNFINVPMAIAGLRQIITWEVSAISESLLDLTSYAAQCAHSLGWVTTFDSERIPHLLGIRHATSMPSDIGQKLSENKIYVSIRGNAIRVAPYLYNQKSDMDRLFEVLKVYSR